MKKFTENEYPCYYIDSNRASQSAQNLYKGIIWATLTLMFISIILVSIAPKITNKIPHFDFINGCIMFTSVLISVYLNFQKPERNWYLGRAIAESIKTLTWRYMMHAAPFQFQDEKTDLREFSERIEIINKNANAEKFIPKSNKYHLDIITKKMLEIRSLSFSDRKEYYAKYRINEQIEWYGNKSDKNKLKGKLCSSLIIACQLFAAIYLFEFIEKVKFINMHNIFIFLATSTLSIIELNKYKELHQSYSFTKQELNIIRSKLSLIQNDDELNEFVLEAEQAISREHTMWLARRGNSNYVFDIHTKVNK